MSFLRKNAWRGTTALLVGILVMLVATIAFAQDAGVSGVPSGPGNANGLNNFGRDPSGIGNAGKVAPLPGPSTRPVSPPVAAPLNSTRPSVGRAVGGRTANLHRAGRKARSAAVKENDRLLNHGVRSICRGC
jgi:hypothetical protein